MRFDVLQENEIPKIGCPNCFGALHIRMRLNIYAYDGRAGATCATQSSFLAILHDVSRPEEGIRFLFHPGTNRYGNGDIIRTTW